MTKPPAVCALSDDPVYESATAGAPGGGGGVTGLVSKYEVLRYGKPVDDCFVLRYDRDPHALVALAAYAASVRGHNRELSEDLWRLVKVHDGQPFAPALDEKAGGA